MQPEELKLLELLQADEEAGTIYFKNRRMLIFDSDAMGFLRKGLIESMGIAAARRILAQFGYARGYRDALTMKESFDWKTPEDLWRAGTRLHALEGIVGVNPVLFEFDKDAGIFHAEAAWINSYEAEQHLKHIGKSNAPVCWTLMGYAGGYSSAVLGSDVIYFETECIGKGDERCYVVGRSMLNDRSEAVQFATELYHIQDFDKEIPKIVADRSEIQSLMRELEHRSLALAEQEEKVRSLESQVFYLQESINQNYKLEELVGVSPTFKQNFCRQRRASPHCGQSFCEHGSGDLGVNKLSRFKCNRAARHRMAQFYVRAQAAAGLLHSRVYTFVAVVRRGDQPRHVDHSARHSRRGRRSFAANRAGYDARKLSC